MNNPVTTSGQLEHLPIDELRTYGRNPRKGNIEAIAASLTAHGQYKPLVVNTGSLTGEPWAVLAGNHTLMAMRHLNQQAQEQDQPLPHLMVPCWIIDVDADEAARIVLADNRTSDQSTYNTETLVDLLGELPDLTGTGYTYSDLEELQAQLNTPEEEPPADEITDPYEDFITIRLQLPPHLAQQWLAHTTGFGSDEEALEYLLDHGAGQ